MDRRVERTRRHIYLAFFELLKKKSMDEITITELANAADIDRRTFYTHYHTVVDVYDEFKQGLQDRLRDLLELSETNGIFDFDHFFDGLGPIMEDNREFYEKLSKDKASMFLRYDCKEVLEAALLDYYKNRFPGTDAEKATYISLLSYGVTGLGSDFLTQKQALNFDDFFALAIPCLERVWVPRT